MDSTLSDLNMESAENSDSYLDDENSDDDSTEFYFESDHVALRGNLDYRSVLRTIVVLEAQRIEATKHIDRIAEVQNIALNDPEAFVQKLASSDRLDLPGPINIQNLPKINFDKYNVTMPPERTSEHDVIKSSTEQEFNVRGRTFDETKPETFNQLWTCDEQQRLEELLIEYPPEPIEMRRYTKIAKALGNRTPRQVASRLQKYFQKLYAAGLPVPGRIPRNSKAYISTRKHRLINQMIRPTTFFPSSYVPVTMGEDDQNNHNSLDSSVYRNGCTEEMYANDDDDYSSGTIAVDEPIEMETNMDDISRMKELIRRVRRDKEKEYPIETASSEHMGFRCDYCNEEPIYGTRWHCMTCDDDSVDYCSDCLVAQLQNQTPHPINHTLVGFRVMTDIQTQSDDGNDDEDDDDKDEYDDEMLDENAQTDDTL